jgi:hypothetical protein
VHEHLCVFRKWRFVVRVCVHARAVSVALFPCAAAGPEAGAEPSLWLPPLPGASVSPVRTSWGRDGRAGAGSGSGADGGGGGDSSMDGGAGGDGWTYPPASTALALNPTTIPFRDPPTPALYSPVNLKAMARSASTGRLGGRSAAATASPAHLGKDPARAVVWRAGAGGGRGPRTPASVDVVTGDVRHLYALHKKP